VRWEPDLPPGAILRVGTERFRHRHDSGQAVFSPDGKVVASASLRYGTAVSKDDGRTGVVEFWEAATGRLLASRPGRKVAFAADGRSMAILDLDAVRVYDWPKPGEKPRTELTREVRDVVEFALSPNGRTVILSNDGNSVGLITGRYNFHDLGHSTVLMLVDTPDPATCSPRGNAAGIHRHDGWLTEIWRCRQETVSGYWPAGCSRSFQGNHWLRSSWTRDALLCSSDR
jgi:hypothetical protein